MVLKTLPASLGFRAYLTVAVAEMTCKSLVKESNFSGLTWVWTLKGKVFWTKGTLKFKPGLREPPLTFPNVVTTETWQQEQQRKLA